MTTGISVEIVTYVANNSIPDQKLLWWQQVRLIGEVPSNIPKSLGIDSVRLLPAHQALQVVHHGLIHSFSNMNVPRATRML